MKDTRTLGGGGQNRCRLNARDVRVVPDRFQKMLSPSIMDSHKHLTTKMNATAGAEQADDATKEIVFGFS